MKYKFLPTLVVILLFVPFGCTENELAKDSNFRREYSESLSKFFNQFATHLKERNFSLSDAKGAYLAGLSFANQFTGKEKEDFVKSYQQSYSQTITKAANIKPSARTLDETYNTADLTSFDIPETAQAFIAHISKEAYTTPIEDIIALIDEELSGQNAQYYEGDNNIALQLVLTVQETARFLRENPDLFGTDVSPETGRVLCGGWWIAGATVLGGVFGGAVGFIGGSFVLPGVASVAGGISGAEVGGALGAIIGGATLAVASKVFCDQQNATLKSNNNIYDPYDQIGYGNPIDYLRPSNLLISNIAYSAPTSTNIIRYNLF